MRNLDSIRNILLAERTTMLEQSGVLAADAALLAATHASGDMRREILSEGDTVSVERHVVSQLSAGVRSTLAHIDLALSRLEAGTYGLCSGCSSEIPLARLEIRPHATTCVPCASKR